MARGTLIAALLSVSAMCGPAYAADDAGVRLSAAMESCLKANASAVEQAEPSLVGAVNFLTADICGREVVVRQAYVNNTKLLNDMRQSADAPTDDRFSPSAEEKQRQEKVRADTIAALAKAYVDPVTGELMMPEKLPRSFTSLDPAMAQIFSRTMDQAGIASVDARALAARALLDARMSRMKTGAPR